MKHKLLIAAAATALMAAPSLASAQDGSGWYLKGAAGYGAGTDIDLTGSVVGDVEAQGDLAANLGIGYDFGENWRLEVDGTTMWNDYGAISQVPSSFVKLRTDALMLNAIYDFSDFGKFAPYVGAGIGVVRSDASVSSHDFPRPDGLGQIENPTCIGIRNPNNGLVGNDAYSCEFNDNENNLGWQLLAGLGYNITDKLTWDTNYRYMQSGNADLAGTFTNVATGFANSAQTELDGVGAHQLLTGFRYRFGASAPKMEKKEPMVQTADFRCWDGSMVFNAGQCPAEPERVIEPTANVQCWDGSMVFDAAQCPVQQPTLVTCPDGSSVSDINFCPVVVEPTGCTEQYKQEIIYYEFDKGASAETRNAISRILDAGQFCSVEGIRVVGHTDTSGAASYNLALSKRRANDALNELVRQGVARGQITAEGKGETEPFVQTGDGVKEQLNRRTEVLVTLGSVGAMVN